MFEIVYRYNHWFDRLDLDTQFRAAFWSALGGLGVILLLTFYLGLPFEVLVVFALLVVMGPRVMFKFGLMEGPPELGKPVPGTAKMAITAPSWVYEGNAWFEAQPDHVRILAVAAGAVALFVVDVALRALIGSPFGLWIMLAALVVGWARVVYANGWLVPRPGTPAAANDTARITADTGLQPAVATPERSAAELPR